MRRIWYKQHASQEQYAIAGFPGLIFTRVVFANNSRFPIFAAGPCVVSPDPDTVVRITKEGQPGAESPVTASAGLRNEADETPGSVRLPIPAAKPRSSARTATVNDGAASGSKGQSVAKAGHA